MLKLTKYKLNLPTPQWYRRIRSNVVYRILKVRYSMVIHFHSLIHLEPYDVISFTLYPAYISSVVIVGFLFNKSSLNLYFLVVQGLVLYLSLGWGIDVLVHRITLTLPLVHWFQLRLLLVNWEYLVDSLSGIMLVIIALISLNVNVYSVDLLDQFPR